MDKTIQGLKKRFKITSTGKVMYKKPGMRHGMIGKSRKLKRQKKGTCLLTNNAKKFFGKILIKFGR